jgi:hypothetical protein
VLRLFELKKKQLGFADYPAGLDLSEGAKKREVAERKNDLLARRQEMDRRVRAEAQGAYNRRLPPERAQRRKSLPLFGGDSIEGTALAASKKLAGALFSVLVQCCRKYPAWNNCPVEDTETISTNMRECVIAAVRPLWLGHHAQVDEWFLSVCEPAILAELGQLYENLVSAALALEMIRINAILDSAQIEGPNESSAGNLQSRSKPFPGVDDTTTESDAPLLTGQQRSAERGSRVAAAQERWRPIAQRTVPFSWIHNAAGVDHKDAYSWKGGRLSDKSVMALNIERVLREPSSPSPPATE